MHVWMLKTGEPWPLDQDNRLMRTGRLTKELLQRGHQVTWWTGSIEHKTKQFRDVGEWDLGNGLTVIALPGMAYKKNISVARYINHRQISARFTRAAKARSAPNLVLASLPCHHLALAGVRYAKANGCVSIVDHRDLWPDAFEKFMPNWLASLALKQEYHVQKQAFALADAIVGVSPGYVDQGLARAGRDASKFDRHFYLGASAPRAPTIDEDMPEGLRPFQGRRILAYVGTFGQSYDLVPLIEAARELAKKRNDFVVAFCGDGEQDLSSNLKDHPAAVGLGWMTAEELGRFLPLCYAGMMPFREGAPQSIPNKAFDYFSASMPVISSLEGEMENLIQQKSLGVHYRPGDPVAIQTAMEYALDSPEKREVWAQNASLFYEEEGNSESIYPAYCEHLEGLVANAEARWA